MNADRRPELKVRVDGRIYRSTVSISTLNALGEGLNNYEHSWIAGYRAESVTESESDVSGFEVDPER